MSEPRFTAVLAFHQRAQDEARRALGRHEHERADFLSRIDNLNQQRDLAGRSVKPELHQQFAAFWTRISREIEQLQNSVKRVDHDIDKARTVLTEAHRQVATFEKLRLRDGEREQRRQERIDMKYLDDFAARGFIARRESQPTLEGRS